MATNNENTPARRIDDRLPGHPLQWEGEQGAAEADEPLGEPLQQIADRFKVEADGDSDAELRAGGERRLIAFDYFKRGWLVRDSSTAGATRQGGNTSLEGLTKYVLTNDGELAESTKATVKCSGEVVYVSDVERLFASIPPLTAPTPLTTWQPIETAPKDGSEVLLFLGAPWNRVAMARWFDTWENWQEGEFPNAKRDEYCGIGSSLPTHWAPIPAAPGSAPAPQQSELSDERIKELSNANRGPRGLLINDIAFARAIEREVLGKAAPAAPVQTAEPVATNALLAVLDAYLTSNDYGGLEVSKYYASDVASAIEAARNSVPTQVVPVAWMNPNEGCVMDAFLWQKDAANPQYSQPVYAAPVQADKERIRNEALISYLDSRAAKAPAVPVEAIGKILVEVMAQASANGANSVSMPDEYVAVAHFVAYPEKYAASPASAPEAMTSEQQVSHAAGMERAAQICDAHESLYRGASVVSAAIRVAALRPDPRAEVAHAQQPAAPFQQRVHPWMMACFGAEISADTKERNHRFFEESTELVQACGMPVEEAHMLVDYVYGRPLGEKEQEVGGVMVTLAALCLAQGIDMHQAAEVELVRIWTKVEAIRTKQASKPKNSPLPAASPASTPEAMTSEQQPATSFKVPAGHMLVGPGTVQVSYDFEDFTKQQIKAAERLGSLLLHIPAHQAKKSEGA